jgi:hypothetical protein
MDFVKTFESFFKKKDYLGQCDRLRSISSENEQKWIDMMKDRQKISFEDFIENVDGSKFLDEDETMESYLEASTMSDNETATYISHWGDKECMFFQTAGFEFIFI